MSTSRQPAPPADHEQRRLIEEQLDVTMLVEAAAGTGKTTSMVNRMVALLLREKCTVDTLAAVTFTRKAAAELRARFQQALERRVRDAEGEEKERLAEALGHVERCSIGTIHSFCGRLLRERPIEAGVDLAFEELEPEADLLLREQAWSEYVAELYSKDDSVLLELQELGLDIGDLREAFLTFADYPDVTDWPAPAVELGDLEAATRLLRDYLQHMRDLAITFPDERGNDKLMDAYERIVLLARQLDLTRPSELMELFAAFSGVQVVQKEWPEGKSQGKEESDRWEQFRMDVADPLIQRWREKRYATVVPALQAAVERYDSLRQAVGGLNYQDLLMRASAMLRDQPEIRRYFRRRFTHLLVDEFQDTDPIQAEVMMFLTAEDEDETDWRRCRPAPGSLFVVGDPKQSIYRFRRADIVTYNQVKGIIQQSGGRVVALTTNFRGRPGLIEFVNTVFADQFPAAATEHSPAAAAMEVGRVGEESGDFDGLRVLSVPDQHTKGDEIVEYEADLLARTIRDALDSGLTVSRTAKEQEAGLGAQVVPGDFLIVTRNKKHLALYAQKLQGLGIPHQVTGGRALSQVGELWLLAAYVRAVTEPENPVALVAVLRGELLGMSDADLYEFKRAGGEFCFRSKVPAGLEESVAASFREAFQRLERHHRWMWRLSPLAALERIVADLGLSARAAAGPGGNFQAGSVGKALEQLRAVPQELTSFSALAGHLSQMLEDDVEFDGLPARPHEASVVRLMNLHQVKGLEAPIVFIADPTGKSNWPVALHVDRSGEMVCGYMMVNGPRRGLYGRVEVLAQPPGWERHAAEEKLFQAAEETRLLYVAATRAGACLTVTVAEHGRSRGYSPWKTLHPFLEEQQALPDPGSQQAPQTQRVALTEGEIESAPGDIQRQWTAVETPGYGLTSATAIAAAGGAPASAGPGGEHGAEWGTVIHGLLEIRMRQPDVDLAGLAGATLVEEGLSADLAPVAVQVVEAVMASEIWRRAKASQQVLTELPFIRSIPAAESEDGVTSIVRGVIDLVFREADGWVVVDYKTDVAAADDVMPLVERYRDQVQAYSAAWTAMTGETVKEAGLFFTAADSFVSV